MAGRRPTAHRGLARTRSPTARGGCATRPPTEATRGRNGPRRPCRAGRRSCRRRSMSWRSHTPDAEHGLQPRPRDASPHAAARRTPGHLQRGTVQTENQPSAQQIGGRMTPSERQRGRPCVSPGSAGSRPSSSKAGSVSNAVIFVLGAGFLLAVTIHAMLGIWSIVHDLDLSHRAAHRLDHPRSGRSVRSRCSTAPRC